LNKISLIILALLAAVLAACSSVDDAPQPVDPDDDDIGIVAELSRKTITWIDSTSFSNGKSTQAYTYSYRTQDAFGDTIRLTALIGWPDAPVSPTNLLIGCHITITDDRQAPSNFSIGNAASDVGILLMHAVEGSLASSNALVIMPDYEGYGGTVQRTHPYLCQQLTARQVVDAVRAGMKFFKKKGGEMASDWKSVVVGYSQGGAVAMATHRLIEQDRLSDELHFCGSVCGDGPYDLMATFRQYVSDDKIYNTVVMPLILQSLCEYNASLKAYQPTDFLTSDFVNTGVLDLINQKNLESGEIQERIETYILAHPGSLKLGEDENGLFLRPEMILRPECIVYLRGENVAETDKPKVEALIRAIQANAVWSSWSGYDNWQPQHPMELFHSVNDEVVPFINYTQAYNYCRQYFNGRRYDGSFLSLHVGSGYLFFGFYCTALIEELLQGKASVTNQDNRT
jgi:hypothetical protein